jgi:cysteine desulfurase
LREIYLDNAASTRVHPEIAQISYNHMTENYGNPSSLHAKGLAAKMALDSAREKLAGVIGASHHEIYFTSGGTEANNIAILGGYNAHHRRGKGIVSTKVEHPSALESFERLSQYGANITLCDPSPDGNFNSGSLVGSVSEETILLSCMMVCSETGAVAPVAEISKAAKKKNKRLIIHCDAVQALGKLPVHVRKLGIDLMSMSGHKIHAPKGIGALYIRKGVRVMPLTQGGKQEGGIRPGTENVPLACAFAEAAQRANQNLDQNTNHFKTLLSYFMHNAAEIPEIRLNSPTGGVPYILNISVPGYLSGHLINFFSDRGIYVSGGSACSGGSLSHVLTAMNLPISQIKGAMRLSFSSDTTIKDLEEFFKTLKAALKSISRV